MKIGILGWGSLLTERKELEIENTKWYNDGPFVPIEFARISKDKRLTLVIHPAFDEVQTYYAVSIFTKLDAAIANLALREKTEKKLENVAYINFNSGEIRSKKLQDELKKKISIWNLNKNLDALIWTDLDENFKASINQPFSLEASIRHLKSLNRHEFEVAKNYILKAPDQTITKHRNALTDFVNLHTSIHSQ
jgi:hypothetical protein